MKVIFLDIDGVLNTHNNIKRQVELNNGKPTSKMQENFCPDSLDNLKEIVKQTNAKIVISSTWRTARDMPLNHPARKLWKAIINNLSSVDIHREIIDTTPYLKGDVTRGQEIKIWLEQRDDIEAFVIIDDDKDMDELTETNLAWCNGLDGINNGVRDKAIEILNMKGEYNNVN